MAKTPASSDLDANTRSLAVRNKPQINIRLDPMVKLWLARLRAWTAEIHAGVEVHEKMLKSNAISVHFSDKDLTSESAFVSKILSTVVSTLYFPLLAEREISEIVNDIRAGIDSDLALLEKSKMRGLWWKDRIIDEENEINYWLDYMLQSAFKEHRKGLASRGKLSNSERLSHNLLALEEENKRLRGIIHEFTKAYSALDAESLID